jgi:dimeric dUTPase (all-alpha-NTP-PPase superfamily)
MNDHQNLEYANPLRDRIIAILGDEWKRQQNANDSLCSLEYECVDGEWITIYFPNSPYTDKSAEKYSDFTINFSDFTINFKDELFADYESIDDLIKDLSTFSISELYDELSEFEEKASHQMETLASEIY